ncbi:hypothetical protein BD779DRAFT_882413 [Infundibulicybe gibba]|nr:hypothetical protein BD779DRAFT_882413 [Infundibulicybe gibba]
MVTYYTPEPSRAPERNLSPEHREDGSASSPRRGSRSDGTAPSVSTTEPSPCVPSGQVPLNANTSHTHDSGSSVVAERSERRQLELSARKRAKLDQLVSEGERKANGESLHGPPSVSAEGCAAPFRRESNRVPPAPRGSPRASIVPQSLAQAPTPAPYLPHHRDTPLIGELRENLHSLLAQAA